MEINLINLPYEYDAFDSVIDKETMEIHHSKHLQAYINNYVAAVTGTKYEEMEVEEVLRNINEVSEDIRKAVQNNGGGIVNHNLYFQSFALDKELKDGEFKDLINSTFGSLDELITLMQANGAKQFGSGWSWLVLDNGQLKAYSTANQDSPLMNGHIPLLGIDVWEHSYYLKYQNKRPEYLKNIFSIINWDFIESLYLTNK